MGTLIDAGSNEGPKEGASTRQYDKPILGTGAAKRAQCERRDKNLNQRHERRSSQRVWTVVSEQWDAQTLVRIFKQQEVRNKRRCLRDEDERGPRPRGNTQG